MTRPRSEVAERLARLIATTPPLSAPPPPPEAVRGRWWIWSICPRTTRSASGACWPSAAAAEDPGKDGVPTRRRRHAPDMRPGLPKLSAVRCTLSWRYRLDSGEPR